VIESNPFHKLTLAKIIERPIELAQILQQRHDDSKVVVVKGVYDLFHSGHYYSFVNAKSYGNILVVAVNSDAAVRMRKGENRPIINQKDRMMLIAALACVDWVTLYEEESPYQLLKTLKASIFAASHFQSLTKEQREEVQAFTTLQTVPKMGTISTTKIVEKLKVSGET
jgi:rfaE bifunctional protein nucleotidyltransferase chain/domain